MKVTSCWPVVNSFVIGILLTACGENSTVVPPPDPVNLQAQYSSAVAEARTVTSAKISHNLTPINRENQQIIWENGVIGSRLLVTTWLGDAGKNYQCTDPNGCVGNTSCKEGGECPTFQYDTWVTVSPELKKFFGGDRPQPIRIAQLLGLPPEYAIAGNLKQAKYMLEMWVSPKDLFRPCSDTEISEVLTSGKLG